MICQGQLFHSNSWILDGNFNIQIQLYLFPPSIVKNILCFNR
jgi:hypothetical protein